MEKALSDIGLTTRFSFQIPLYLLVKQKENLTLHQVPLKALFCAPQWYHVDIIVYNNYLLESEIVYKKGYKYYKIIKKPNKP